VLITKFLSDAPNLVRQLAQACIDLVLRFEFLHGMSTYSSTVRPYRDGKEYAEQNSSQRNQVFEQA
jgi:hypothetical protein